MPTSAPATMPNATSTISVTSVARSATPRRLTAAAILRAGPDQGQHVAALDLRRREDRNRRPGAHDPTHVDAAREFLSGEIRNRAAVDLRGRHDDLQHLRGDIEELRVVHFPDGEPLFIDSRHQQLAAPSDRQRVAGLQNGGLVGLENSMATPDSLDEQTGIPRQLFELAGPPPIIGEPGSTA